MKAANQAFEIEDDVGDIFLDAREGREFVRHTLDLDRAHGSALDGRQQHPTQRVAERMAKAAVERLDHEAGPIIGKRLARDCGHLEL